MDLKDVIKEVRDKAVEAHNAFHAGHHDVAENYLMEQMLKICAYFNGNITLPEVVKTSASTEKTEDEQKEKPEAALGDSDHLDALHPLYGPQKGAKDLGEKRQTQ